jgi:synaptobrevin family protein YKT6
LAKYQKPEEVDKVAQIEKDVKETQQVMMKTFDQMLARGERLEDLLDKSDDLRYSSKVFMKKTQRMNRCCTIL